MYRNLVDKKLEMKRKHYQKILQLFTNIRGSLENVLSELLQEKKEDQKKDIIRAKLPNLNKELMTMFKECLLTCEGITCESCAVEMIKEIISRMDKYNDQYVNESTNESAKELQRSDLMQYIEEKNDFTRKVLRQQTKGIQVSACDEDRANVWDRLK